MDFVLNFAMFSADFTRVNRSTIQIVSLANYLKGLTFWILNTYFQETASLSIVLSFFIHKISSRILRHPSWNGSHLTRITFANFIQFLLSGSVLDTFRYAANEFYVKICFTVYLRTGTGGIQRVATGLTVVCETKWSETKRNENL